MMVKRLMVVMLMVALIAAVVSVGGIAEADEPDYTDPEVVLDLITKLEEVDDIEHSFLELSPMAQQAVVDAIVNDVETVIEVVPSSANSGAIGASNASSSPGYECDDYEAYVLAHAIEGKIKIWKYSSSTH